MSPLARGDRVVVLIGKVQLSGTVSGFPTRKAEYPNRPVIVRVGPAEYVTVDLAAIAPDAERIP